MPDNIDQLKTPAVTTFAVLGASTTSIASIVVRNGVTETLGEVLPNLADTITTPQAFGAAVIAGIGGGIFINTFEPDDKLFTKALCATDIGFKAGAQTLLLDSLRPDTGLEPGMVLPAIGVPLLLNYLGRILPANQKDFNIASWSYIGFTALQLFKEIPPTLTEAFLSSAIPSALILATSIFLRSKGITIQTLKTMNAERRKISDQEMEIIGRDLSSLGFAYKSAIDQLLGNIDEADERNNEIILSERLRNMLAEVELEFVDRVFNLIRVARMTYKNNNTNLDQDKVKIGRQAVALVTDHERSIKRNPFRRTDLTAEQIEVMELDLADKLLALIPDDQMIDEEDALEEITEVAPLQPTGRR